MMRGQVSLRWRLLGGAVLAVAVALALAGWGIARLFERHVTDQFDLRLQDQMTQVLAALQLDAQGGPVLGRALADPRWERPYSGLYWQVQAPGAGDREPVLRSWSLWDERLFLPADGLTDGALHLHVIPGPAGQRLRALERVVQLDGRTDRWRVIVAADVVELESAQADFRDALVMALLVLGAALMAAVWVQVGVGLRPLRDLQAAVQRVRDGHETRLQGALPTEVRPLVDDFNLVLAENEQGIERSRRLAGNLAHAIKTPLAVMAGLADDPAQPREALARQLREQVEAVRRQVDWHLRRARAASASGPARRTPVAPVLDGLLRVMAKVHAPRDNRAPLELVLDAPDPALCFAGEEQDLQEMAGNLLDNACKWARSRVVVTAQREPDRWRLVVDDDGPGLAPEQCVAVLQRGVRADEQVPGTGLGLDIVRDIASLYGGELRLGRGPLGGLRAELRLPSV